MNLDQFNSMVSASLRRGTTLDSAIPQQTALAVQWLERNFTFKYMECFRLVTIVQNQRVIQMPKGLIKSWIFFRIINSDGSYSYLNKVEGKDLTLVNSTANTLIPNTIPSPSGTTVITPGNFFQVGLSNIVLDAVPSQNFNAESMFYNYSSWPTDTSTIPGGGSQFTHPIIDVAADLLLAQTQMLMSANITKDLRMMAAYKEMRDEAVNTLTRADDETKYGGESMKMLYNPGFDEKQINTVVTLGF